MQETVAQLEKALAIARALASSTEQATAIPADVDSQANAKEDLSTLSGQALLASAPASVGLVSERNIKMATAENIAAVAGKSVDISAAKRFTVAAGDLISLCAHKLGLKLFAAKGKLEIHAQDDGLDLFAERQLRVASANEDVLVSGKTKTVVASGGACVKIENGTVEIICPGDFRIKAASFTFEGPANLNPGLPSLPKSKLSPSDDSYLLSN
jgi:type VI secretion system secreted protein VgrG